MPFCPDCRYEFDPHVRRCSECGAELIASLEEDDEDGAAAATAAGAVDVEVTVFCPTCRHVFPPSAEMCPECDAKLMAAIGSRGNLDRTFAELVEAGLHDPDNLDTGTDPDAAAGTDAWETVHQAASLADAAFVESVLEGAEIESRILEGSPRRRPDGRLDIGADVQAPKDRAEEARTIIAETVGEGGDDDWEEGAASERHRVTDDRAYVDRLARAASGRLGYGDGAGSLVLVREALSLRPDAVELVAIEAQALALAGKVIDARAAIERGLALAPGNTGLLEQRLWASLRGSDGHIFTPGCDLAAAEDAAARLAVKRRRDVRLREIQAEIARRRGEGDAAVRAHLDAALVVNPDFEPAKKLRAALGGA